MRAFESGISEIRVRVLLENRYLAIPSSCRESVLWLIKSLHIYQKRGAK